MKKLFVLFCFLSSILNAQVYHHDFESMAPFDSDYVENTTASCMHPAYTITPDWNLLNCSFLPQSRFGDGNFFLFNSDPTLPTTGQTIWSDDFLVAFEGVYEVSIDVNHRNEFWGNNLTRNIPLEIYVNDNYRGTISVPNDTNWVTRTLRIECCEVGSYTLEIREDQSATPYDDDFALDNITVSNPIGTATNCLNSLPCFCNISMNVYPAVNGCQFAAEVQFSSDCTVDYIIADFGDGTSPELWPIFGNWTGGGHTYAQNGTYTLTVVFVVTGPFGNQCAIPITYGPINVDNCGGNLRQPNTEYPIPKNEYESKGVSKGYWDIQSNPDLKVTAIPNPASDQVTFNISPISEGMPGIIRVFSLGGKLIGAQKTNSGNVMLNVSEIPSGAYIFSYESANGDTIFDKLIIR